MPALLLDNGAGSIKAGWHSSEAPAHVFPNATAKVQKSMQYMVGDQIHEFLNSSLLQFTRPFDRGYTNNWQCEIEVWSYLFNEKLRISPQDTSLVVTEPLMNLETIQNETNEIVFEYFGFKEYFRRPAPCFSAYQLGAEVGCTVVDSGFSFTHVVPFVNNRCQRHAIRRINIGGKLLTNFLKEMVSYRQWNMMDEFLLMNQVKEELCYVSNNIVRDLAAAKSLGKAARAQRMTDYAGQRLRKHFVLPDFQSVMRGFVKPDDELISPSEQVLVMETERMSVPELLFTPLDVGLQQAGLAETTLQSLSQLSFAEQAAAASRIVLTGGNVQFPNFLPRYQSEVIPMLPDIFEPDIILPAQPALHAWQGMQQVVGELERTMQWKTAFLSKQHYEEVGHHACNRFFDSGW